MKKLKKSAVVIPALARIAVTAAASVSGTVAWFTANRSVTINASNFQAKAESGALSVTSANLVGVVADENTNKGSVKMADNNYLTDGSFDFTELYTKDTLDDEGNPVTFKTLGNYASAQGESTKWNITSDGKTLWYGVSWTWNFTYKFSNLDSDRALFFNIKDSVFAFDAVTEGNVNVDGSEHNSSFEVGTGFRLARTTTEKQIVWAPAEATNKHVGKNDSSSIVADNTFAQDEWHLDNDTQAQAQDVTTGSTNEFINDANNSYCYLGKFTAPKPAEDVNVKIPVVCTAWFEGTDPNVINSALSQVVTTTQKFYVRKTPKNA